MKNNKVSLFDLIEEKRITLALAMGGVLTLAKIALAALVALFGLFWFWWYGPLERGILLNKGSLEASKTLSQSLPRMLQGGIKLPIYRSDVNQFDWWPILELAQSLPLRMQVEGIWSQFWPQLVRELIILSLLFGAGVALGLRRLYLQASRGSEDKHLRGAKFLSPKELQKEIKRHCRQVSLPFGAVKMPVVEESRHVLILGSSGTGKTVLLSDLLDGLLLRGERVVVHDYKGDMVQKFFNPDRDFLFNPFDQRSIGWSIFDAMELETDLESVAMTLIPRTNPKEPFFEDAARALLIAIFHQLLIEGKRSYARLKEVLALDRLGLLKLLAASPSEKVRSATVYLADKGVTASSVLSTLANHISFFSHLEDQPSFALEDWLQNDRGVIFLANHQKTKEALRPMLTLFLDTLAKKLLAQPDQHPKQLNKTVFLLDELGRMGRLDAIEDLLTQSRSKGGVVIASIQDLAQITALYGPEAKSTFLNNCGTKVCFSLASDQEARVLSEVFGEQEVERRQKSYSYGVQDHRDGAGSSILRAAERLVLPSEIQTLKPLHFYLRFPGFDLTQTQVKPKDRPDLNPPFVQRQGLGLSERYSPAVAQKPQNFVQETSAPMSFDGHKRCQLEQKTENPAPGGSDLELNNLKY